MIKLERPSLPLFAIGAGAVHLIALALLLPLLITLPGPGSNAPPKPVNIEVDLGSRAEPAPIVPDLSTSRPAPTEQISALPEAKAETPDVLANVSPEAEPASEDEQAAPVKAKPVAKSVTTQKAKPKVQAKAAKPAVKVVRAPPQKKPLLGRGKSSKPFFGGSAARSKAQGPSWSALLNAPPSAADATR